MNQLQWTMRLPLTGEVVTSMQDGQIVVEGWAEGEPAPTSGQVTYTTTAQVKVDWSMGAAGMTVQDVDIQLAAL